MAPAPPVRHGNACEAAAIISRRGCDADPGPEAGCSRSSKAAGEAGDGEAGDEVETACRGEAQTPRSRGSQSIRRQSGAVELDAELAARKRKLVLTAFMRPTAKHVRT